MSAYGIEWQQDDNAQWVENDEAQWTGLGLMNRFKATINSALIDATLTDFPIALYLSEACGADSNDLTRLFDELTADANRKKIAVTTSDGITQCPVEIEHFDVANEVALLHVKVPSISSSEDTDLYVHYDSDQIDNTAYVGDTGDAAAQSVWDSNFVAVYHMSQDPAGGANSILDSTANGLNGTPYGSMDGNDLVAGVVDGALALEFDGNDYITTADDAKLDVTHLTMEAIIKPTDVANDGVWMRGNLSFDQGTYAMNVATDSLGFRANINGSYDAEVSYLGGGTPVNGTWYHMGHSYDGTTQLLQVNGAEMDSATRTGLTVNGDADGLLIGGYFSTSYLYHGRIGEVRLSDSGRNAAWLKATYNTLFDLLITYRADSLANWTNRVKFTIDADLVDTDLTNFPIALLINSSCGIGTDDMTGIFDELTADANRKKIAVTTADGFTQCYVEIEFWDDATETAVLHVKVPHVESSADTVLYLYYDSDQIDNTAYVGDTGDAAAQSVWDDDFEAVWHLAGDPSGGAGAVEDSTSNENHADSVNVSDSGMIVGQVPGTKGYTFNGSTEHLDLNFQLTTPFNPVTFEYIASRAAGTYSIILDNETDGSIYPQHKLLIDASNYPQYMFYSGTTTQNLITGDDAVGAAWTYIAGSYDQTTQALQVNATRKTQAKSSTPNDIAYDYLAAARYASGGYDHYSANIAEIRYSSIARSAAWLKATYHALFDTFGTWSFDGADVYVTAGTPAQITWSVYGPSSDTMVVAGTPAQITWSPQAATVSVTIPAGTPAQITWAVLSAAASVSVLASTPSIAWSALAATITQNFNAIGIVSKPTVSASKPSITATGRQPDAFATGTGPSITVTGRQPGATATGAGPSASVTGKGD